MTDRRRFARVIVFGNGRSRGKAIRDVKGGQRRRRFAPWRPTASLGFPWVYHITADGATTCQDDFDGAAAARVPSRGRCGSPGPFAVIFPSPPLQAKGAGTEYR